PQLLPPGRPLAVLRDPPGRRRLSGVADQRDKEPSVRYRIEVHADTHTRLKTIAEDVRNGLSTRPRSLPPKYFYDATGSRLFDEITRLPEYYLTRVEEALLDRLAPELMR